METSSISVTAASDPEVLAASEVVRQSDARVSTARAEILPSLSVNGGFVGGDDGSANSGDVDETVGFRASVPVFRGFSGINGVRQAQAERTAAAHVYDASLETAIVRLVTAIAEVERDRRTVQARASELAGLNDFLRESRQRMAAGSVSGADVEQIKVQVAETEAALAQARANLSGSEARRASLLRDIGLGDLAVQDVGPALPASEQEAIRIAVADNPTLQEARWRAEAGRHGVQSAFGALAPAADFSVVGKHGQGSSDGLGGDDDDLEFRFDIQLPLFDGGARLADVRARESTYRELSHRYHAAHRDLIADVRGAWARHVAAAEIVRISIVRQTAARRALNGVREARRIGARSTTDELDARRDSLNAAVAVADARLEQIASSHQLLLAIGRIRFAYNISN